MAWHVRGAVAGARPGRVLDRGQPYSFAPVAVAKALTAGGFVLPGLVDAHTHPGAPVPGEPLDEQVLRADLAAHRDAGVTAVRVAGAPSRLSP